MKGHMRIGLALAAALAWPHAAAAQSDLVDATDPQRLASLIQGLGYRAQVDVDGVGDPLLISSVGGSNFRIYFYGCTDNKGCKSLLYKIGYDLTDGTTLDVVNGWNSDKLFGRAYLDDENDPWLELSVNMAGGVSQFNFEDTFDWWEVIIGEFEDYIDF